jgi:hypothetical protein
MTAKMFRARFLLPCLLVMLLGQGLTLPIAGQGKTAAKVGPYGQELDEEYGRLIAEATTSPEFQSPLTNYLPRVKGVPTPKDVLGYIAGAPGKLTPYKDILDYMHALAKASPNVEVFTIGKTSEGRDMVQVAIADAATMKNLAKYKEVLAKLADPRVTRTEQEADALIAQAKPVYWLTGNLHSPETGAAEMSMELAYRLAVDNNPFIKRIRDNVIVLISPSIEPDGHEKHTEWFYKHNKDITDVGKISRVPYWGKYTFHDNNRDMIVVSQPETQAIVDGYFDWHATVLQDNHESIPLLYVSSGTGPYNPTYEPSVTSEWNLIAWWEVTRLTSWGMPGVWTSAFWDGWTPNYMFSVANNHNSIGRFYETFGNAIGNTMERTIDASAFGATTKEWYRPLPAPEKVLWSMRNNNNYQQSGTIMAFYAVATHKEEFLKNFWRRGLSSYTKGKEQPPHAYVIPSDQKDPVDTAYLVNVLLKQRIEVHESNAPFSAGGTTFPAGSYVVKLDQPYRNFAYDLLGIQRFPEDGPRAYDDVGWTLGLHMDVKTVEVNDRAILDVPMVRVTQPVKAKGEVSGQAAGAYIIPNQTVNTLLPARFRLKAFKALAAQEAFTAEGRKFDAGSMIIPVAGASADLHQAMQSVASDFGLRITAAASVPNVRTHELDLPRIAIFHTWHSTQDDGWVRSTFDSLQIPFAMIHKDHMRKGNLKASYDVIVFSNCGGATGAAIVNEIDPAHRGPLSFVKSAGFPSLGTPDAAEDITGGMGIEGVRNLQQFVEEGGLLIALHNPVRVPVDYGMVRGVSIFNTSTAFYNPGSLLKGQVVNPQSPIAYGYDKEIPLYRRHAGPLLTFSPEMEKYVVVRYGKEGDVCLSGLVKSQDEIKGKAAIASVPVGKGHIVLFTFNPLWREKSRGQFAFVFNAIMNYNDLSVGAPVETTSR